MKKLRLLISMMFIFTVLVFSQPNYPEITSEEFEGKTYVIIYETDSYYIIELDGEYYLFFFDD